MIYPCKFCQKKTCIELGSPGTAGLNISTCRDCHVEYHYYFPDINDLDTLKMFRYKIINTYKGKTYSLSIFTEHDSAQLYQHPDDPQDTWIMVATILEANIQKRITPTNFLEKLPTLLTFS